MAKFYQDTQKQITFLQEVLHISSTSRGVDLGCNEGLHVKALQKISPTIYGVDTHYFEGIQNFVQLNFFDEELPWKNLDFAYILSPYFDQRWWEFEIFLQNLAKSLRKDSDFVLDLLDGQKTPPF